MSKALTIGAAATAGIAAAAGAVYYTSPASQAAIDTPPILVEGTPGQALAQIRAITAKRYLQAVGIRGEETRLFAMEMSPAAANTTTVTLSFDSERLLVLHARARAVDGGKTELDIAAELPDSRFTAQPSLHPYDLKVLAAMADLAATDYVSSILKRQRMASGRDIERMLKQRIRFDEAEGRAFADRVKQAVRDAYGQRLEQLARQAEERERPPEWARDAEDARDVEVLEPPAPPADPTPGVDLSRYEDY